ncbi:hypothetical protein JOF53_003614 [Crossiella equi]|uniref:DUF3558 domain-containing protein n=1 Tax=Crossiella equi TaxID=130796 RepID=A0ABS5ADT1_9PSEU|nr:hypothetical protein [Crossiella equi]MBP2474742.1 hypothetical protein [Crossiella equi]
MTRPLAGLLLLALATTSCGGPVAPVQTPPPAPATTTAKPAVDKYTGFQSCQELVRLVPGLPPVLRADGKPAGADRDLTCEFATPPTGPFVTVKLASWRNDPKDPRFAPEVGRGRSMAKMRYDSGPTAPGPAPALGLGDEARWQRDGDSCQLTILDNNAVLRFSYTELGENRVDPVGEQCRESLRRFSKPLYEAVQPR